MVFRLGSIGSLARLLAPERRGEGRGGEGRDGMGRGCGWVIRFCRFGAVWFASVIPPPLCFARDWSRFVRLVLLTFDTPSVGMLECESD